MFAPVQIPVTKKLARRAMSAWADRYCGNTEASNRKRRALVREDVHIDPIGFRARANRILYSPKRATYTLARSI